MKHVLQNMYKEAERVNMENIIKALGSTGPHQTLLDIGCWDGKNTLIWAKAAQSKIIYGLEAVNSAAKMAQKNNIITFYALADVDKWPIPPHSVDCIISNQLVEHLSNLDHYFSECSRVLKHGGYLITSTNNLSSWHNIGAILLGWTPFDFTNSSAKSMGIGNPLALHRGNQDQRGASWTHKCIYTAKWFSEWGNLYKFQSIKVHGAGYYPLPANLGKLDPLHSAFITLVMKSS